MLSEIERRKLILRMTNRVVSKKTREKLRKANLGKHLSEETKRKIGNANRGLKRTKEQIRRMSSVLTGIKRSKETRLKIAEASRNISDETRRKRSLAMLGRKLPLSWKMALRRNHADMKGEKSPCWEGGKTKLGVRIRNSEKYIRWRSKIFKRDKYKCQNCYQVGGKLVVHHKRDFKYILDDFMKIIAKVKSENKKMKMVYDYKPFWNKKNGITMCDRCHKNLHSRFLWEGEKK